MKPTYWIIVLTISSTLVACSDAGPVTGPDAAASPDAPGVVSISDADCAAFARNAATASAGCGAPLPAGAEAALTTFCKKGVVSAATCGGNPNAGLACFKTPDASDFQCIAGEAYPACNGDLAAALGMYCVIALGNPQCASGIKCDFDTDCSGDSACNDATGQCFSKTAYCVGLPCTFDVDCPSSEKCNSAEHACVAR